MMSQNSIDKLNNFMKFYVTMDVFSIVFDDWNLIIVLILIILIKCSSKYGINDQTFTNCSTNNTCQKHDEEFVNQRDESVIIDNTTRMIREAFGNSTKQLIASFFIACKVTSGAAHSAHGNNLNANYSHFRIDPFANYCINTSICSELFFLAQVDTIVDGNKIIAKLDQLLTDTMKAQVIFSSPPAICEHRGNLVVMRSRQYNTQEFYLYITQLASFYLRNEIKDAFEGTIADERGITLRRETRTECSENTDAVFNTLFGNTTKHAAKHKTK